MVWVGISVELLLIVMMLILGSKEKKKVGWNQAGGLHLLQTTGKYIAKWLEPSAGRREKNEIYQIVCKLAGEEEGAELFRIYRQKRWGMILGAFLLINGVLIGHGMFSDHEDVMFEAEQQRPSYGEGDINEQVTVILNGDGDKQTQSTISIHIPEKEISKEEAQQRIQEGIQYIQAYFADIQVKEDISLPAGWNEVTFYYESLAPWLLSNNGAWIGEITEESQIIDLKITAELAGQRLTDTVRLTTVTLSELSAEERLSIVTAKVEKGEFLTENELVLPEENELGEKLKWIEKEDPKEIAWILMSIILVMFAMWKQDLKYKRLFKEREQHMRQAYPEFINELVILVGAGLSLPAAWKRIGQDYQSKREEGGEINPLYEQVYRESKELEAGLSMREVLEDFSFCVRVKEARRFAVLLIQNLKRGDAFLVSRLRELNQEAWNMRKKQAKEKTEEADTKLLLPLMLMLVVILIIVLSPAMITMQM